MSASPVVPPGPGWDGVKNQEYWSNTWSSGLEPGQKFDARASVPVLVDYVAQGKVPFGRALVPGCGRGYDVELLAHKDREAVGLDIVPLAADVARDFVASRVTDPEKKWKVLADDFFTFQDGKYNFIFDYTFLCALDPSMRKDWAKRHFDLLESGGVLMTLIFPIDPYTAPVSEGGVRTAEPRDPMKGPPFLLSFDLVSELCSGAGFEVLEAPRNLSVDEAHPGRPSGVALWRKP